MLTYKYMKQRLLCGVIIVSLLVCSFCTACNTNKKLNKYTATSFDYFDTASIISGYATSQEEFDVIANEILSQLAEYHKLYTIYHRFDGMENLCTINELVDGKHRTVKVDRKIVDMLKYAKEMYALTNGKLNVAMGSVLSLWHSYRTIGRDDPSEAALPPMDKLREAAKHTDISNLIIDEENLTVTITDPLMTLDVGAIAKGYATEQIALWLEKQNVNGFVLNIGGNVKTIGVKPNGEKWTVGVENSDGTDYLAYLNLSGESVVTSGSYQRYYIVDGKKYHHIIHPTTLMPAQGYVSVSVICKNSGLGDALSTALFCMPFEEGKAFVENMTDVEVLWVFEDGKQFASSGFNFYKK